MDSTLNQQTYDRLKKDIMTFALKPGDPVSAAKLAERYNVSRTPAREALVRLQAEGLIDIFPQSKSVISKINVQRVRQEWFIRKTLELGMVDNFFKNVTEDDIKRMKDNLARLVDVTKQARTHETSYEYMCADYDFHAVSYYVAGEFLAADVIKNMAAHYDRFRLLVDLDNIYRTRTVSDHEKLIELVEKRDKEGYSKALEEHLCHIITDIDNMGRQYPDIFELE